MNESANPNGASEPLPEASALSPQQWREMCLQLLAEHDELRDELAETERERREYLRLLIGFLPKEELRFTDEEALGCLGQEPTLKQLIGELEQGRATPGHG
jgi:hypothetical protein